jgi:nucleotide-binding universal stress UspA family protein
MKTLLVPTEQHDVMAATLDTALLFARRFDSYVEGFALRYDVENFITMDPVSGVAMDSVRQNEEEAARQARDLFHSFMQGRGMTAAAAGPASLSFGWSEQSGGDNVIGSYGRVFDCIVLGRPGSDPRGPRANTLEAGLFESGRPILIAPPSAPQTIGENVLIAWNGSTEQAHTTALAMPILERATRVTVLTVQGSMVPGPSGEQLVAYLARHGIPATHKMLSSRGGAHGGEVILAEAAAQGCDLVIKGAYTQSRLRQMIFGGATRHILASAMLPVFMAH